MWKFGNADVTSLIFWLELFFSLLQSRTIPPYVRTMGMDHRWQDIASMVNFPSDTNHAAYHHHHHHYHAAAAAATSNYSSSMASSYPSHHMQIASSAEGANTRNALLHNSPLAGSITDLNNSPYSGLSKCSFHWITLCKYCMAWVRETTVVIF